MCWLNAFPPSIKISSESLELSDIFVVISLTQYHLNLLLLQNIVTCTLHTWIERCNLQLFKWDFYYLDFDYIAICSLQFALWLRWCDSILLMLEIPRVWVSEVRENSSEKSNIFALCLTIPDSMLSKTYRLRILRLNS